MLSYKVESGTGRLFVLDHLVLSSYFRYQPSTQVLDKILDTERVLEQ